jgi:hypothetical protein
MPESHDRSDGDADIESRNAKGSTGAYSATKAPENQEHVVSERSSGDDKLLPGGKHAAPVDVGMAALHRATVPSQAADAGDDD